MRKLLQKLTKFSLLLGLFSFIFSQNLFSQAAPAKYEGVMLQGFYWDSFEETSWTALNNQNQEISNSFDLIWLPPSGNAQGATQMGYHPIWFFDQNSAFGTQPELKTLISNLKNRGCGAVADIVINHRNGVSTWTDFPSESYKGVTYTWGPWAICQDDEVKYQTDQETPTGAYDTGDNWDGARDIDHTNLYVQETIKAYLDFMKNEMGYTGWRYDLVKGYAPYYVGLYNMAAGCEFSVGECWDNYDRITSWIDGTIIDNEIRSGAFDFEVKYALNKACNDNQWNELVWQYNGVNQPAGIIHNSGFRRFAYTFVDNHDTYKDGGAVTNNVLAANAFILSHPGIPCVFYPHWRDNKVAIDKMIEIRKKVGVHSQSTVEVLYTSSDTYAAKVSGDRGSLVIKVGTGWGFSAPSEYGDAKLSGTNFAIWALYPEEGTLTSSVNPVIPNMETTLYYDGTETNFKNWTPDSHIHAWIVAKPGETFSKDYSMSWTACEGSGDYGNLDEKLKMTQPEAAKYQININIQDFFGVEEEDLSKIAKLGIIVRALYDEGSNSNKTINFLFNVDQPAAVYEGFTFNYGIKDQAEGWQSIPLSESMDAGKYTASWEVPSDYAGLSCFIAYNGGIGDPKWVQGQSETISLQDVTGFQPGNLIISVENSSSASNWNLAFREDMSVGINEGQQADIVCYGENGAIRIEVGSRTDYTIYSICGLLVKQSVVEKDATVNNLNAGLYFVKINNVVKKVLVK